MYRRLLLGLVHCVLVVLPAASWSGAVLLIYPTEVLFEGAGRSAEVMLTNRGDAIGTFETSWIEMGMRPEGVLAKREPDSWSIQPYIRYSPRRVTLAPGESQVIRIALRPSNEAAEGEYYTHLRILTLNQEDLDAGDGGGAVAPPENADPGVSIRARSAIAIPVIWRNSAAEPEVSIESVAFDRAGREAAVTVRRGGRLSARGYLHVFDRLENGEEGSIGGPIQVVIYPNLATRAMRIPLEGDRAPTASARVVLTTDEIVNERTMLASVPLEP